MKKILLGSALTALLCNANADVDQSLTGLHVGLGINILFDEYNADVDVAEAVLGDAAEITATITPGGVNVTADDTAAVGSMVSAVINAVKNGRDNAEFSQTFANGTATGGEIEITNNGATPMGWVTKRQNFKRRATNVGGELKLAYFHDFGNNVMIGVDLSGTIVSKTKKHVKNPFFAKPTAAGWDMAATAAARSEGGIITVGTPGALANKMTVTIDNDNVTDDGDIVDANPGCKVYEITDATDELVINDVWKTLTASIKDNHTIAGDKSEVSFEKDAFIPRLAFVLGGTYLGWFAGVRLGMAYMTGKVTATDANGSHSKSVSISSPFIGLHLMKQMNIKGINNGHVYVTADWHVGDGHRAVNINGIKSFKQNAFNLAAGLTWRCKLGR